MFEWDESKAASNLRKHGVSFADALLVFSDPYALIADDRVLDDEMRWHTLGLAGKAVLVLVVHTLQAEIEDEIIRIISARKATRKEREHYDENRAKEFSI